MELPKIMIIEPEIGDPGVLDTSPKDNEKSHPWTTGGCCF
jgi:hypothetical protein